MGKRQITEREGEGERGEVEREGGGKGGGGEEGGGGKGGGWRMEEEELTGLHVGKNVLIVSVHRCHADVNISGLRGIKHALGQWLCPTCWRAAVKRLLVCRLQNVGEELRLPAGVVVVL